MTRQTFKTVDLLRLEVGAPAPGTVNLAKNPHGLLGAWGWVTPVAGGATYLLGDRRLGQGGWPATPGLYFTLAGPAVTPPVYAETEPEPVTPGQFGMGSIRLQAQGVQSGRRLRLSLVYYSSDGAEIGVHHGAYVTSGAAGTTVTFRSGTAIPAGTARMALRVALDNTSTITTRNVNWDQAMVTTAATAGTGTLAFVEPYTYTDVLAPSHEIEVTRAGLTLGTLTAKIRSATLDPAINTLLEPGNPVRLMCRVADASAVLTAEYQPLFTGEINRATVNYDLAHPDPERRALVHITAVDAAHPLANTPCDIGVGTVADLRFLMEGAGVPWEINGSTDQVPGGPGVVSRNDNAKLLDQIATARDTQLGHAFVRRDGVLYANTAAPTTVQAVLSEPDYTADIDIDYDTARCINTVNVKRLSIGPDGATVETPFGPYEDPPSVRKRGAYAETFTVNGLSDAAVPGYAQSILTANSVPRVRVNRLAVALYQNSQFRNTAGDKRAHLDLFDRVTVNNARAGLTETMRVASIRHTIRPKKWLMDVGFAATAGVSMPNKAPAITPALAFEDTPWTNLPLLNGWANYGGIYQPAQYCRRGGEVHFRGLIVGTARTNPVFAIMDPGFRHTGLDQIWDCSSNDGPGGVTRIDTRGTGGGATHGAMFWLAGGVGFVSLAQISYIADA